jgi:hypothetical protein
MRARCLVALACALCTAGAISCSDDDSAFNPGLGGGSGGSSNAGRSNGGTSNGGTSNAGTSNGGSSSGGSSQGGSANAGAGGLGDAGSAGSGMAGSTMVGAGAGGEAPDAGGGDEEPDSGPVEETVSFAADLHQQIFVPRCGGCHGNSWGSGTLATAYSAAVANAEEIAGRVDGTGGNIMPANCGPAPGEGNCLSVAQVESIQFWVDDGTPE